MKRLYIGLMILFMNIAFPIIIRVPQDYPTIQQGIDAAGGGDIVLVAPGTYYEEILLKADVVVKGAGEGRSVIHGGGNSGDVVRAVGNAITNTTKLQGFTITGASNSGGMPGGGGVFCNSGAAPEICNNRVEGNDQGIAMWNQSAAYVHNNVVIDNVYTGISISSAANIVNNTVANNNIGMYDSGGWGPIIMNNVVTGNTTYGLGCVNSSVPTNFSYNDVWNNGQNYYNCSPGPGDISTDPLYVDEPGGDFHLQIGSPCIDAGNPLPQYNDPDGTRNDMGAYGGPGTTVDFPLVDLTVPYPNENRVLDSTEVLAVFNVDMDPATFTSSTVLLDGYLTGSYQPVLSYDSAARAITMNPVSEFKTGERITAVLTKYITSLAGDSLEGFTWQFITRVDSGSGMFTMTGEYATGVHPTSEVVADFNGDGNIDIATGNSAADNVSVLLGNGDGSFQPAVDYPVGTMPMGVCTADFDEDGNLDIAVANETSNNITVLIGIGDGTFVLGGNYSAGTTCHGIGHADFNADGDIDLVVTNSGTSSITICSGNGDGTFSSPTPYSVGTMPNAVTVGDFNNDGALDIATVNLSSNNVSILLNDGAGDFSTASNYSAGAAPYALCLVDLNGDRVLDIVTANSASDNVSRLLGNGDGSFGSALNYVVGDEPCGVGAGDFNGDGNFDIAAANVTSNSISILTGTGSGALNPAVHFPAGSAPLNICIADLDSDLDLDIATTCHENDSMGILLNESSLNIVQSVPAQYDLDVPRDTDISATFSLALDSTTINDTTFLVTAQRSGMHTGTLTYSGGTYTATFNPDQNFHTGEGVTAILTREIQSLLGPALDGFIWHFTSEIPTASDGTFGSQQNFPTGMDPRGLWAGDYDLDGDIDLASTSNLNVVSVLMNNGDGTYASPVNYPCSQEPIDVFGADLDMDGDVDLAVVNNRPGTANLDILRNNGNGTFTFSATYTLSIMGNALHGSDFDADGDIDIVLSSYWGSNNNVDIMLNNGNGTFSGPFIYTAGTWAHGVIARDVDNDGDVDLAVVNSGNNNVSILRNDGSADFSDLANYPVGASPYDVTGNDFNGDGFVDIATAEYSGNSISVVLNNGDGSFGAPVTYITGSNTRLLDNGDFDGDNDIDLVACANGTDSITVMLNMGNGVFDSLSSYSVGTTPWGIQCADVDLDGDLDLACANYASDNVTILYNTGVGAIAENKCGSAKPALQIYPNPCAHTLHIECSAGNKTNPGLVTIYDISGRAVRQLMIPTGSERVSVTWDGRDGQNRAVASGVYFCRFTIDGESVVKQVVLLR